MTPDQSPVVWLLQTMDGQFLPFYAPENWSLNEACEAGEHLWARHLEIHSLTVATCFPAPSATGKRS